MAFHFPDKYRITNGAFASSRAVHGDNGAAFIPMPRNPAPLKVIASNGDDLPPEWRWEHVSVSLPNRTPTWAEMCFVKELFWDPEDAVMQLHPPKSRWVNNHNYCLHLWRPVNGQWIPLPQDFLVGVKELGVLPL